MFFRGIDGGVVSDRGLDLIFDPTDRLVFHFKGNGLGCIVELRACLHQDAGHGRCGISAWPITALGHSRHSRYPGVSASLPKATEVLRCHAAPLCAISGREQMQQTASYLITSLAATCKLCGTMRPRALAVVRSMTRSNF